VPSELPRRGEGNARFRWVIGTPYFVQGTTSLVEVPTLYFIKFGLEMGDAGGQLFDSLRSVGWFVKPLWGYVSDRVSLFGYHRKSWFVLMALLAVVFWLLNAVLIAAGLHIPIVFLVTFNLAFGTYAFVDVVGDALMVTRGRESGRVASFVVFQWTVFALASAGAALLGGWLQKHVEQGEIPLALVFTITGVPPLFTAFVGWRYIEERPAAPKRISLGTGRALRRAWSGIVGNRTLLTLMLFVFFWKFSPSIGYIERSYLIDRRGFEPEAFGAVISVGSITFLVSLLSYRWIVRRFRRVQWHHYLYAMVAIAVAYFPLSFYLYLDPDHPWWQALLLVVPDAWSLPSGWNQYEAFRMAAEVILGFATIPAFVIPLTIAGETVRVERAGVGYAFITALSNATNMFEGAIGAGLYRVFERPELRWLLEAFRGTSFNIAGTGDERTLILEIFVYIGLFFTLLTLPFLWWLHRELRSAGIEISLSSDAHG